MTTKRGLVSSIIALTFISIPALASAATNLIQNPSFTATSTANANIPANWSVGGFNSNFAGSYPVAGPSDAQAAMITISAVNGGDAKWVPDQVPVQAGAFYTFSDQYNATVPSSIVAAYTHSDATQTFETLGNQLASTTGTWQTVTRTLTVPAGVTSMSVYHVIQSVGSITTDNYNLELTQDAAHNLFSQGLVSLTFDDGWNSTFLNGFETMQANNLKGTFYVISNPMLASAHDLFTDASATADMTTASTTLGKTWTTIYTDPSTLTYFFSDTYTSTSTSVITVSFTIGVTPTTITKTIPAGTNVDAYLDVVFPGAIVPGSLAISHKVASGSIFVSNPSMIALKDAYMSPRQVKILKEAGNEIGVHTKDHCSVAQLEVNPANIASCALVPVGATSMADQISGARNALLTAVNAPVDTFAYPYGQFNANVQSFLSANGFAGARATTPGYNTLNSDHYALQVQTIDASTTPVQIKSWIDYAVTNHLWLILLFHQIDSPTALASNGETGGTTPAIFAEIAQYLAGKPAGTVKTVHEVLGLTVPTDIVPPVITTPGQISTTTTVAAGKVVTFVAPTAVDAVDGNVTVTCNHNTGDNYAVGTTTVSCSAHDAANNTANASFDVVVVLTTADTVAPVITLNGPASIDLTVGSTYTELGATTTDNLDVNVPVTIGGDTVNTAQNGTYVVTYDAVDAAGNHATQVTRTIVVQASAPVSNGGGGGGGGGGGNGPILGTFGLINPQGVVLGASTSTVVTSKYTFNKNLTIGSRGADVMALQQILIDLGYLDIAKPTGYFGQKTKAAVKKFQAAHSISATGFVGPLTRAALNSL